MKGDNRSYIIFDILHHRFINELYLTNVVPELL